MGSTTSDGGSRFPFDTLNAYSFGIRILLIIKEPDSAKIRTKGWSLKFMNVISPSHKCSRKAPDQAA